MRVGEASIGIQYSGRVCGDIPAKRKRRSAAAGYILIVPWGPKNSGRRIMRRYLPAVCVALAVLPQLHAANSTIYTSNPGTVLTTLSTKTLKGGGTIPAGIGSTVALLSSDGNTFYMAAPNGQIIAVERLTGKTLRTYHTKYPIWNPVSLALAPNQSRIYVDTCSSSADGSTCQGGNVEVLDVASGQNLAVISVGTDQVFGIAAAPNGKTVYAAHYPNSPDCCFSVCCAVPASTIPPSAITAFDATSFQPVGSLAFPTGTKWHQTP